MIKLLHVFFDTDMRGRHEALLERAKKERGFKRADLSPGDMLCFINTKRDRIMVIAGLDETDTFGVLGYYRSPHGRIDEMAIQFIPDAFAGGQINYNEALKQALHKRLSKRAEPASKPKPKKKNKKKKPKFSFAINSSQGASA